MVIEQDKKPVPFIKAKDLIKVKPMDCYITIGIQELSEDEFIYLSVACDNVAFNLHSKKHKPVNIEKVKKLAKRFKREFLRNEHKEKPRNTISVVLRKSHQINPVIAIFNGCFTISNIERLNEIVCSDDFKSTYNESGTYIFEVIIKGTYDANIKPIDFKPFEI